MRDSRPSRPGPFRGPPGPPQRPGPGRPYRPAPAATNPLPIIYGSIGVVLVVVLIFVAMSGGKEEVQPAAAPPPPPPPAVEKPVDVSGLEREGYKYCDEGLALIRSLQPKFTAVLNDAEKHAFKEDLKKGIDLIMKGMGMLSEANEKSGKRYDTTRYGEARVMASKKYHELK